MEDADIEQRFHLTQKEIEVAASITRECRLDMLAAIDSLKIELEVLKSYMELSSWFCGVIYQSLRKRRSRQSILNGLARRLGKGLNTADPVTVAVQ